MSDSLFCLESVLFRSVPFETVSPLREVLDGVEKKECLKYQRFCAIVPLKIHTFISIRILEDIMAKIKYAKSAGKPIDETKRSEAKILGKASEESLKERRQIASELKQKQGKTNLLAKDIFIGKSLADDVQDRQEDKKQ